MCDHALNALGAAPQRPMSHGSLHQWIFGIKIIPAVSQPTYSPNLSPCDFFLFSRLKNHLKGRHFGTLDNIQKSVADELKGIPAEAFQHCYEQWKQRLRRCVVAQGNYFKRITLICKKKLLSCHTTYAEMIIISHASSMKQQIRAMFTGHSRTVGHCVYSFCCI